MKSKLGVCSSSGDGGRSPTKCVTKSSACSSGFEQCRPGLRLPTSEADIGSQCSKFAFAPGPSTVNPLAPLTCRVSAALTLLSTGASAGLL